MTEIHIKKVLDYIEAHLKGENRGVLDNAALAKIAGYSEYHFLRLFREVVGLTPADYIRKRRISEIVKRIGEGSRPISDIAFEYGFNSKENFTRAFKNEHGILPTEFRTANCSLRLFEPFSFDMQTPNVTVSMIHLKPFALAAYRFDEASPPRCWNKYNAEKRSLCLSGGKITEDYGAMVWNSEKAGLDYYIGIRKDEALGDISDTVTLNIAGGLYAVFDTPPASQHDFVGIIRRTWDWIYKFWLPQSGYGRADGYELERYTESSREYTERIYIPLVSRSIVT